jgi:hypothetical protein
MMEAPYTEVYANVNVPPKDERDKPADSQVPQQSDKEQDLAGPGFITPSMLAGSDLEKFDPHLAVRNPVTNMVIAVNASRTQAALFNTWTMAKVRDLERPKAMEDRVSRFEDLAVHCYSDRFYVLDSVSNCLLVYKHEGHLITQMPLKPWTPGQPSLVRPLRCGVGDEGCIYVTGVVEQPCVQEYSPSGVLIKTHCVDASLVQTCSSPSTEYRYMTRLLTPHGNHREIWLGEDTSSLLYFMTLKDGQWNLRRASFKYPEALLVAADPLRHRVFLHDRKNHTLIRIDPRDRYRDVWHLDGDPDFWELHSVLMLTPPYTRRDHRSSIPRPNYTYVALVYDDDPDGPTHLRLLTQITQENKKNTPPA